ncbi:tigger transposable element-derived protein 6-like [Uloborus diversus]|uniref:tigger transposable element-derived protein 6-like n=1 Tax=Uloborus diversus TaxID=327109 RepID=UPI0024091EE8|nr:tigger transposable element-derived protein 6-like [Uloborus diversus]
MAGRKQISFQDKLNVISDVDDVMKQVDAAKKYGLSQSTVATFLKKRKHIEDAVRSNLVNPKQKRLKVATNENIDAAILKWFQDMRATNIPINGPLLCAQARKYAAMLGNETFKASNGNSFESPNICVPTRGKTGKKYGVNVEDYLTADDDLTVFAGVTDEEILSEITGEMEHSGEEDDEEEEEDDDDNTSPSQSLLSTQEALQSVKSLRTFFSSLPSTNEDHFRALDSMLSGGAA